ncbi:hypothetical protein K6119_09640 [Paracrocinitomix mangrovi]|uniref:hypothetical protein n=1 Tax=Paracrocinitomix mangrovi TaxID=2862509 RepID=UPI001C8D770D|nr:hypothetical protein [Paracrocinitomix mangrovi]UKN03753.1 hypothetical protein K6119_09640 [Paracrocinitomix mangrovi]
MLRMLIMYVVCLSFVSCNSTPQYEDNLDDVDLYRFESWLSEDASNLIQQMDEYGTYESQFVGAGGSQSEQWTRYEKLKSILTLDELVLLTKHPSATVRAYAYEGVCSYHYDGSFNLLKDNLHDTARIETLSGCELGFTYVGDIMIYSYEAEFIYEYPDTHQTEWDELNDLLTNTPNLVLMHQAAIKD